MRDWVKLEMDTIYKGEWDADMKVRMGRGFLIWPKGSIYEGFWKNSVADGWGRLIHHNGDVYEGEWHNDQAHGYGSYEKVTGSKYTGDWEFDE